MAFLKAHLKKFIEDEKKIEEKSRPFEGVYLFYYYSFSQFILEINKLFDCSSDEYYSIPKLLNHIESNIKSIEWYRSKVEYIEPNQEENKTKNTIWKSSKRIEWQERASDIELKERQKMIADLKSRINNNKEELEKIQKTRDKFIAHLDKDFHDYELNIPIEMAEKLFGLAHEIFDKINQEIRGKTLGIEFISSNTLSTLMPIKKYYQIRGHFLPVRFSKEKTIDIEYLNKIIQ